MGEGDVVPGPLARGMGTMGAVRIGPESLCPTQSAADPMKSTARN
jgi:hypothetical protein